MKKIWNLPLSLVSTQPSLLDWFEFVKRPTGATTQQNRVDPSPGQEPVFFFFLNVVFVPRPPFLFLHLLYNELLLAAKRKGEWGTLLCSAAARGWSKERELGLGLAEMGEAGDNVCGATLLCQWAAILVWPRDRDDWGSRKGLSNFDQKARGWLRERWGKLWSDLCGSCFGLAKREALAGSRRENPKLIFPSCFGQGVTKRGMREGGGNLFFFFW
jgi:hypothetical protein